MYTYKKEVDFSFDEALTRTVAALKTEGFGILTEIDVQATLKKKLNVDFDKYIILGACNPPFAYQSLQAERDIGLLLPCNVVVREREGGGVRVSFMDPEAVLGLVERPEVVELAREVKSRLQRVSEALREEYTLSFR